ncbi:MBL fold metallo-hydrolase [Sphingomonas segetis]|uniref:MBL fold metallo-hydrolase n=1 Tax=Sphingomonas segetis TaxID=1104779 RepID=UPI0012D30D11|nr:MBL fold metallo-hydrolase [Sphingomonas segetis]
MRVRILGCGTSTGVPKIGNDWGQCDPAEPRNVRLRTSILVESAGERMLVDCGPDLRQQLLAANVGGLEGVIVTHVHGDHCHGIDELRPVARANQGPVSLHARAEVLEVLRQRFGYAFAQSEFYRPIVEARKLGAELAFGDVRTRFVDQPHGDTKSLGMRFDEAGHSVAYAVDFSDLTDGMAALYQGADVWIADCLTRRPHPTHAHLDAVLGWARQLRVGQLCLVHMGNSLDYRTLASELPDWAAPAYDGFEIA